MNDHYLDEYTFKWKHVNLIGYKDVQKMPLPKQEHLNEFFKRGNGTTIKSPVKKDNKKIPSPTIESDEDVVFDIKEILALKLKFGKM